jgi:hypothetical protein
MATITAASCLAQLSTISHELATVREQLKKATSTVMSPDVVPNREADARRAIMASVFPDGNPLDDWEGVSEEVRRNRIFKVHSALGPISTTGDKLEEFIAALNQHPVEDLADRWMKVAASHVARMCEPLVDQLSILGDSLSVLKGSAEKLLQGANVAATSVLRVKGATGISRDEALAMWNAQRLEIAEKTSQRSTCIAQRKQIMERISSSLPADCSIGAVKTAEKIASEKADRDLCADLDKLIKMYQAEIYAVYSSSSEADMIQMDKSEYEPFKLPKHFENGDYEKFKLVYLSWRRQPQTIMKYDKILYDFDYVFDAIDAVQGMHMQPPDQMAGWNENVHVFNEEMKEARKRQFTLLYDELFKNASEKVRTWCRSMHSVGQGNKLMLKIDVNGGFNFMYLMLAEHVKFTASDQQFHVTAMMGLKAVFVKDGNVLQQIEQAREIIRLAEVVGVRPEYTLHGKQTFEAMGRLGNEFYHALRDAGLLPSTVLGAGVTSRNGFKADDCTFSLDEAFSAVQSVQETLQEHDDSVSGKRKHPESAAAITSLKADCKANPKGLTKAEKQVSTAIKNYSNKQPQSTKDQKKIYAHVLECVVNDSSKNWVDVQQLVEACATTLQSDASLKEADVQWWLQDLRSKGKYASGGKSGGKAGGKGSGGKNGGKAGGKGSGGKNGGKASSAKTTYKVTSTVCSASGCNNYTNEAPNGQPYQTCKKHFSSPAKQQRYSANAADAVPESQADPEDVVTYLDRHGQQKQISRAALIQVRDMQQGQILEAEDSNIPTADLAKVFQLGQ